MSHEVHILLFALTAITCFASFFFISNVHSKHVKYSLTLLIGLSGTWAGLQVLLFVFPNQTINYWVTIIGLIIGLATVISWLHFASAFTGNTYHKDPIIRIVGLFVFIGVSIVKLTNHIHGQYFIQRVTESGVLILELQLMYWGTLIGTYFIASIGFFLVVSMLIRETEINKLQNVFLFSVIFTPILLRFLGHQTNVLLPLSYEPVGVALFILFVTVISRKPFLTMRNTAQNELLNQLDTAVIVFDNKGKIITFNNQAKIIFPILEQKKNITRDMLTEEHEELTGLSEDTALIPFKDLDTENGETKYYLASYSDITVGPTVIGETVRLKDVTEIEQYRNEVSRHNSQWDEMAGAIAHELRNSISISCGHLEVAMVALENGDIEQAKESLQVVNRGNEKVKTTVTDLKNFTRFAQTVEKKELVNVCEQVDKIGNKFDSLDVSCRGNGTVLSNVKMFSSLLEKTFDYSNYANASSVNVILKSGIIVIEDDGEYSANGHDEELFKYESAAPDTEARMRLPLVNTIALSHGWKIEPDCSYHKGLRYEIQNVVTNPQFEPGNDSVNTDDGTDYNNENEAVGDSDS